MIMQEELVNFQTAKLAKEKGFDEICGYLYENSKVIIYTTHKNSGLNKHFNWCSAPTQSLLQRWLREVHKIEVFVKKGYGYEWYIEGTNLGDGTYNTFEEALEVGLREALKLIKDE